MKDKYKKFLLGRCVDDTNAYNLENGSLYLLKDLSGNGDHFYVSTHVSNSDSFLGAYSAERFEILQDITQEIQALPYEEGVHRYRTDVAMVRMVARQSSIDFIQAQQNLIQQGFIKEPVLDSNGEPLVIHRDIYHEGKRKEPDFEITIDENAEPSTYQKMLKKAEDFRKRESGESGESGGENAEREDSTEEPIKPSQSVDKVVTTTTSTKEKEEHKKEKPKFVQKGLFG